MYMYMYGVVSPISPPGKLIFFNPVSIVEFPQCFYAGAGISQWLQHISL